MEKYVFENKVAQTVLGTFDLIIQTVESTPQKLGNGKMRSSITVEELKQLREAMRAKYQNNMVLLV